MLEILDDPTDARSRLLRQVSLEPYNFYERWLIGHSIKKNKRHRALIEIMDVALHGSSPDYAYSNNPETGALERRALTKKGSVLTREQMTRQSLATMEKIFGEVEK
jgi:hypothetical protein